MKRKVKARIALSYLTLVVCAGEAFWRHQPERDLCSDNHYLVVEMPENVHNDLVPLFIERAKKKYAGDPVMEPRVKTAANILGVPSIRAAYDWLQTETDGSLLNGPGKMSRPEEEDLFARIGLDPSVTDPRAIKEAYYVSVVENADDPGKLLRVGESFQTLGNPEALAFHTKALSSGPVLDIDREAARFLNDWINSGRKDLAAFLEDGTRLFHINDGTHRLNLLEKYWDEAKSQVHAYIVGNGDKEVLTPLVFQLQSTLSILRSLSRKTGSPEFRLLTKLNLFEYELSTLVQVVNGSSKAVPQKKDSAWRVLSETCQIALRWLSFPKTSP